VSIEALTIDSYHRLALEKDPECVSAMIGLGQALLQDEEPAEAAEHLERAISKVKKLGFIILFHIT